MATPVQPVRMKNSKVKAPGVRPSPCGGQADQSRRNNRGEGALTSPDKRHLAPVQLQMERGDERLAERREVHGQFCRLSFLTVS